MELRSISKTCSWLFCISYIIEFVSVADNHHESNEIVKRANGSILHQVLRKALESAQKSLVKRVLCATFHKTSLRRHNKSYSFELLYIKVPKLSNICNPKEQSTAKHNIAEAQRQQLGPPSIITTKTSRKVRLGDSKYFRRDVVG